MSLDAHRRRQWAARAGLLLLAAGPWAAALGQPTTVPGLPPEGSVVEALGALPVYRAALRELQAAESAGAQLKIGPQEWSLSAAAGSRRQRDAQPARSSEWDLSVERPIRWPGKATSYERLGRARVQHAQAMLGLTWREQSRALLDAWSTWWREQEAVRVWLEQDALQSEQLAATARRRALGAAANLEQQQAEAAALQVQAQLNAARARLALAAAQLERRFQGISLPGDSRLPAPEPMADEAAARLQEIRTAHAELALARAQAGFAQAQAAADAAERRPDPTVGLRYGHAGSGAERFVGLFISMPIGGAYRTAGARASEHQAQAAEFAVADAERLAERFAQQALSQAADAHAQWRLQARAAEYLSTAAQAVARAYALGEGQVSEVLAARRLAAEQLLAARQAAVEAWTWRLRVLVEGGQLWRQPR